MDVAFPATADSIADRTFGEDPEVVSDLGSAFIEGLQSQDVAATAKHFPGLGPATVNTDDTPVEIAAHPGGPRRRPDPVPGSGRRREWTW